MIHAPRGIGKTHLALGTAWAVASGGGFLRWTTPAGAWRVLLLDGEMPGVLLQERLARVAGVSERTPIMPDYLRIAAADLVRDGLPDLSDPASQQFYADIIADADLVVVDNLSTICRGLKENEADSWVPVRTGASRCVAPASRCCSSTTAASRGNSAAPAARRTCSIP